MKLFSLIFEGMEKKIIYNDFNMKNWWVYIIQCRNKSLYTGITTDVERRLDEHQNDNKKASKYCARLRPLKLVYKSSAYENKSDASKEEYRIKKLCHKDKLKIIKNIYERSS